MYKKYYPSENYRDIIRYIAKSKRKDIKLYDKAKNSLRYIKPDWDDVKLEIHVLWDVRHYFEKIHKK